MTKNDQPNGQQCKDECVQSVSLGVQCGWSCLQDLTSQWENVKDSLWDLKILKINQCPRYPE